MIRRVLIALALCEVACGGTILGSSTDGGSDAATDSALEGGGPDATGPDGSSVDTGKSWSPVCPENEPVVGSACSIPDPRDSPGLWCEYGKIQYDVSCDTAYQCQEGVWTKSNPLPRSTCQPDGPNAPSCPATYGDLQAIPGAACTSDGLRCEYPQGVCSCARSFGGPIEPDAGTTWFCNPGADCPMPRPRLGASCSGSGQNCQYLTCEFGEACVDGYWEAMLEGCAEPGGSP
jgi:hypothetical protein